MTSWYTHVAIAALLAIGLASPGSALASRPGDPEEQDFGYESHAREIANEVRVNGLSVPNPSSSGGSGRFSSGHDDDGLNVQVNDPALDTIQDFAIANRPFESSIQSETSVAAFRNHIVVGYNSSANQPVVQIGNALFFTHRFLSGFSVSHDGGETWASGFIQPNPGSVFTFGDPSVGVDRAGNFYYASLGLTGDLAHGALIVGKSTDHGSTFAPAVVAAVDDGSDKEWLAVGRDPFNGKRDNLYVAWTSFQNPTAANPAGSSELRLARSFDGGATWTSKTVFAPTDASGGNDPKVMSSFIQFANPVVDPSSGRLFIPFLHFSNIDADAIKVLVSDDAGEHFRFVEFNHPQALDKFGFPNVTPGTLTDCGRANGGVRTVLHQGTDVGGGRFGLPRFVQATRLITQPSAAVARGKLFIAFNSSTSSVAGDPASTSEIHLLVSANGGASFRAPVTIAAATAADPQHVHPSIAVDEEGEEVSVAYYVQQSNGKLRIDLTRGSLDDGTFHARGRAQHVSSVAFDLIPSNIPFPIQGNSKFTTNYDRTIRACYDIGEYMSIVGHEDGVLAAWGDNRNSWTSPARSPAAGTHAQPDVFFQEMGGH
jgi:hypothetical protein